jgi:hypothetical protein
VLRQGGGISIEDEREGHGLSGREMARFTHDCIRLKAAF